MPQCKTHLLHFLVEVILVQLLRNVDVKIFAEVLGARTPTVTVVDAEERNQFVWCAVVTGVCVEQDVIHRVNDRSNETRAAVNQMSRPRDSRDETTEMCCCDGPT